MTCFVIAEIGVNHNGSIDRAKEMVAVAARCGADAVKFQSFDASKLAREGTPTAEYQRANTGSVDQRAMLERLQLSHADHVELKSACDLAGVEFMSSPFDEEAASMLVDLGVARLKIPSGELTNLPFLAHLASFDVPMIMSTGMADLGEVAEAVATIEAARAAHSLSDPVSDLLTLLHCTSNYPAAPEDVNLRAMTTLSSEFALPVGYSDHTAGIAVAPAAVALGASVIEKHFTLDRNLEGPDHRASLEPQGLEDMISQIREVEAAMGDGVKTPRPGELAVRDLVRKSVTTTRDVAEGAVIGRDDLALLRPGTGIPPKELADAVGKRATRFLAAGTTITWDDLSP
ncbi:MAG: N-acetylneuraminate synthase [Acidimicrobiia bacterium]|nr:N-acetylneuraminate synthase [Acidimicrobiia bacterium]